MSAELKGLQGNITLSFSVTKVGRAQENQLILNDTEVSGYHAQIFQQGQGHSVIDLSSRNGTFVNEQKLPPNSPRPLYVGDTLRFGNTSFTYANEAFQYPPTKVAAPSYTPPPPPVSTPFSGSVPGRFQQQVSPSTPPPASSKKDSSDGGTPRWIIVVGGLASLATIFGVIFGIYTYAHPAPSTPTPITTGSASTAIVTTPAPSVPRLHSSYTGVITHNDGSVNSSLVVSSLTEDDNGNFNASGSDGPCSATYQGIIRADGSISFTATEAANPNAGCGVVSAFIGKLLPNQKLEGTWQGQGAFAQFSGSWSMQ